MKRSIALLIMTALLIPMLALSISARQDDHDEDADIPTIGRGKIDKRTYHRLREEHIEKLRGLDKANRDKQKESRSRALRQLDQQERQQQQKKVGSTVGTTSADAMMISTEGGNVMTAAVTGSWTPIGPAPISNGQTFSIVNS